MAKATVAKASVPKVSTPHDGETSILYLRITRSPSNSQSNLSHLIQIKVFLELMSHGNTFISFGKSIPLLLNTLNKLVYDYELRRIIGAESGNLLIPLRRSRRCKAALTGQHTSASYARVR